MKKFFLIIFFTVPMYAGRSVLPLLGEVDANTMLSDLECRLLQIRTAWGYGLPPDEAEIFQRPTFLETVVEFNKFRKLFADFQEKQEFLHDSFRDTRDRRARYHTFVQNLFKDKKRFEEDMNAELALLNDEGSRSNSSMPPLENYISDDDSSDHSDDEER